GNLGVGKTTFVRAFLQSIEPGIKVKSPTYTLVEPYSILVKDSENVKINYQLPVYHFDLYRLIDPFELYDIGVEEYLSKGISFIEWPDKGNGVLPDADIEIIIEHTGDLRSIKVLCQDSFYEQQFKTII
ncbi:MAG: tRNA (adenosine(37)-N6)-threonylcarbamoyltransferase complex ATPase subunit type 1 TsaE, partial [Gammaproteobacteria bacterium]|nr:tRNA (adenosine(37)-N6)-threonylcarbamoyltransferase complex ATPase subunit type 1 TsaE [Gammaproteobacteria bacterium]